MVLCYISIEYDSAVQLVNLAKKRVRNRYWKLVTLLNNPSLVLERIGKDIAEARKMNKDGHTVSMIGYGNSISFTINNLPLDR